ncbi:adhesin [Pseudomonas sp. App30]|uniref:adhesin n=1 Tax=Pseudomonas sp. App30 TaxID=3068990 RepID=UPI003A7FCEAF
MKPTLLFIALLGCASAFADSSVPVVNNAVISNAGVGYNGNMAVNQAAGDQQQQANARAIASGTQASATTHIKQVSKAVVDPVMNARSSIQGNSFSNGNGALGINQTAGANNQQANAMRLTTSAQPLSVDDSALSQQNVALARGSDSAGSLGSRQVNTDDQAFTGSRGLIQLNQSAGVGNRMGNTLSVRVAD